MKICFIADYFENEFAGGAEMSLEALIETCPYETIKINSKNLTTQLLEENEDNFWIFGNYSLLNLDILKGFNLNYSVIKFDYKFCQLRQPCFHWCDCPSSTHGKRIFKFLLDAKMVWFMSSPQRQIHHFCNPFGYFQSAVLSAPFKEKEILILRKTREQNNLRQDWCFLDSSARQKGRENAIKWGKENNTKIIPLKNIAHDQLLDKLSFMEGLVYLPNGYDTCPRLVTEAKLAGCKLNINN